MKFWRTTIVLSLGLALAACGNQQPKKAASSSAAAASSSSKQAPAGVKLAWTTNQAQKLGTFMQDFGPTMDQAYTKADRSAHTKWQGVDLSKVYQAKAPLAIAGKQTPVTWLPAKGHASKTRLNVVAVYADDPAAILYLFTLTAKGHPRVLVSQTAPQGTTISAKDTANATVKNGFAAIAAGRPAPLASKAAATSSKPAASGQAAAKKPAHAAVFGAAFQHHPWYTNDHGTTDTVSFEANALTEAGSKMPVYWRSERTGADKAWDEGTSTAEDQSRMSWGVADHQGAWVDVRGWYQAAGDGESYRISNQTLGGQTVPVLETASGAGLWVNSNYYPTQALATQNQDKVFADENANQ
ncbi:DUF4767 domain-containing protein [Lacticaseibacillus jixianensis]|uniref:DUF4767 domain-containing protein n=1 Tax=Lacticaseibacillus jixianensis TaxID=2486012 RepID=A0ABW4BF04_9LACO|nr:DUF4767 domain-containing protein [Lacticaseibacillus jixianensis]